MKAINASDLKRMLASQEQPTLINTLPPESFAGTRIPGSINIPQDQEGFADRVEEKLGGRDQPLVVYCANQECQSSAKAAHKLQEAGFSQVYDFEAGAEGWQQSGEKLQASGAS